MIFRVSQKVEAAD